VDLGVLGEKLLFEKRKQHSTEAENNYTGMVWLKSFRLEPTNNQFTINIVLPWLRRGLDKCLFIKRTNTKFLNASL
jgi:hypothetical protein